VPAAFLLHDDDTRLEAMTNQHGSLREPSDEKAVLLDRYSCCLTSLLSASPHESRPIMHRTHTEPLRTR
jgi:hypothetical protein